MKIFSNVVINEDQKPRMRAIAGADEIVFGVRDEVREIDKKAFLEAEVVFGGCPPEWLLETQVLRWIQFGSVGFGEYLHLDWKTIGRQIVCTNLHGFYAVPVAETVLAGILTFYRGIDKLIELKKDKVWGKWQVRHKLKMLAQSSVLLAGYGTIGRRIAGLLSGFDCKITAYDKYHAEADIHMLAQFDAALPHADIIVAGLPDTKETRGMFDRKRLGLAKEGAIFVNIGRGSLVDEEELVDALNNGRLGGAVLDVTQAEPLPPGHRLWDCPSVIITQHTGGGSVDELDRRITVFEDNLGRYRKGLPLKNIVDFEKGY